MKKSFTLIELIVVIAIIAILAAIIAPNAFKAIEKAKISKAVGDFKAIKTAALNYQIDVNQWPPTDIGHHGKDPNDTTVETENFITGQNQPSGWDGPYLETWPRVPFVGGGPGSGIHNGGMQEYSNYMFSLHPHPFTINAGDSVIYLQAFFATMPLAQKIKRILDGTDNLGANVGGYGDEPGSIRWAFPPAGSNDGFLYYIIAENKS